MRSLSYALLAVAVVAALGLVRPPAAAAAEGVVSLNPRSGDQDAITEGGPLYRARCGLCHGMMANGRGRGLPNSADLTVFARGYDAFVDTVKNGYKTMPAWGGMGEMTDAELQSIGAYLETLAKDGANWGAPAARQSGDSGTDGGIILASATIPDALAARFEPLTGSAGDTPGGASLLAILEEEAQIAREHAVYATSDLEDVANIRLHTAHVRHALDPSVVDGGPGRGYGVMRAASAILDLMEEVRATPDLPSALTTQVDLIHASAANITRLGTKALRIAEQIPGSSPVASAFFAEEMLAHTSWILDGHDADEDGRVSAESGEGGVSQIKSAVDEISG